MVLLLIRKLFCLLAIYSSLRSYEPLDLQEDLKHLLKGNFNVVAINNHMTDEVPRLIFIDFWATGHSETLAKTFKEVLGLTK